MVMIFEQGDIVYLDLIPMAGHEQRGTPACPGGQATTYSTASAV